MPALTVVSITRRDPTIDMAAGETKYTMTYRVQLSAASGDVITALQGVDPESGLSLPNYGDSFATTNNSDTYAKCRRIHGKQVSGARNAWDFVCEYSTRGAVPNTPANKSQPWVKTPEWGPFDEIDYINVVTRGRLGSPTADEEDIMNTAGQRYNPAPVRAFTNTLMKVRWWQQAIDMDQVEAYRNAINSAAWNGFKARRLKINRYVGSPVFEYGVWFAEFDAEIEVNCDPETSNVWKLRVLEQGTKVIRDDKLVLPKDDNGKDYYGEANLAADGTQLPKGATPVFSDWYIEKEADFDDANLPTFPAHIVKVSDA